MIGNYNTQPIAQPPIQPPVQPVISWPQQMIEGLGRLQRHAGDREPNSIYIYDLVEQRTLCTSYSVAAMLGYTADAIQEMGPTGLASLIHLSDLNRVAEHYQRFTTLSFGQVITIEYRMKQADGSWCRLYSQETPLVIAIDGFPLQILGMIQKAPQPAANPCPVRRSGRSFRPYRSIQKIRSTVNHRQPVYQSTDRTKTYV